MRIIMATPGKFKSADYQAIVSHYIRLSTRFAETSHFELPLSTKEEHPEDAALLKFLESRSPRTQFIILDEHGKSFATSRAFAAQMGKWRDQSIPELVFAGGGAHGYGPTVQARALLKLSLSPLTMAHELAAVVMAEQVFRSLTILANHPYHND